MVRFALSACLAALALAACEPAAEESDDPGRTPTPSPPTAFAQCAVCHQVEPGKNGFGPTLAGVFGAQAGHVGDFAYSQAMRGSGLVWDEATLDRYLEAPLKALPGTKMSYAGLRDPAQRQAVIAYLKTL